MSAPRVTDVRLVRATAAEQATGLLGFVSFVLGSFRVDGATLRRTACGRYSVSFPCRRDGRGQKHPVVRPTGRALEAAILAALRRRGAIQ